KVKGLGKSYRTGTFSRDKKTAVDSLSFEVATGKVTGFLGPNGAGKSTTMRLMLGLDNGRGQTTFDGKALKSYENPSKIVGILLEAKAFHPTRTARRHLSVLATAGDIPNQRVDEVLDIVGLKDVAKSKPGKFSLGMSQRLGIAAAILGEPKYLILDEPANGLDPEGIAWLRQFLRDYAKDGRGVLVSSHLLSEMSQMADNVVVIGKGKLIADTSIDKLIAGAGSSVFVRVSSSSKLVKALNDAKLGFEKNDDGLTIAGVKTDFVGQLAHSAGLTVLELSQRTASLEKAFLELTEGAEEFQAHTALEAKK
ncbi:MAG TPA: ATP-binding cassette domain-containing protein, partial [Candidatus Saccharimonadales bacterium]|nr:ATP-binding cassette domain-containing protein [Candidatus Saccharimonadales bacterium]